MLFNSTVFLQWDYRFLGLLAFSSLFDFFAGKLLGRIREGWTRKAILGFSLEP